MIVSYEIFGPGSTDLFGSGISYYIYDAVLYSKEYGIREMRRNLFCPPRKVQLHVDRLRVHERQLRIWYKTRPTIAAVHRTKVIILSLEKPSFRSRTARKIFHLWYSTAGTLRLQAQENYYSLKYRGILGVV